MKAKISLECGIVPPDNGIINIWWWKDGAELNKELESIKPIWEIFNAHETFLLCVVGETIEVSEDIIFSNFVQINN
jgi:hypothetical protein